MRRQRHHVGSGRYWAPATTAGYAKFDVEEGPIRYCPPNDNCKNMWTGKVVEARLPITRFVDGTVVYIATDDPGAALLYAPLAPRWTVMTWRDVPALVSLADHAMAAAPSSTPAFALFAAEKALCARHGAPHVETYCRDTDGNAPAGLARDVVMRHCLARDGKHRNATYV